MGCESEKETPHKPQPAVPRDAAAADALAASVVVDAALPRKVFVTGAGRCGECHDKMYDEWEVSAHAHAVSSPLYKAALVSAKDPTCDRCHSPLADAAPRDGVASEGVTCDVCHTLREPTPGVDGGGFRLAIDDMVKFGPRCDLKDHYFHRMGCSPEHKEAPICGSCHWWEPKGLPVFTEFADWRAGPAAKTPCQDCHMPKERAALATGSPVRTGVPHHGLLGLASDLRTRALGLEVAVRDDHGAVEAAVTIANTNAGHAVPAGLPEHRIIVRARVRDAAGAELALETRSLGRLLVDASGQEVPFWRATKVGADTRIQAGTAWHETFVFHPPAAGTVEVEVLYRGVSDAIAKQLGVSEIEEHAMTSARVRFGVPTATGRAQLPKTLTVKPPAPGKRPAR
ncbi:MAG: uncharacterized protein JWO36_2691 [Myxococcales bacterium]|nr:uncharacterized protein [Myxococcales bacterium]